MGCVGHSFTCFTSHLTLPVTPGRRPQKPQLSPGKPEPAGVTDFAHGLGRATAEAQAPPPTPLVPPLPSGPAPFLRPRLLETYSSTQCAAVTIHSGVMMEPPQTWMPCTCRLTCQGHWPE